ncbi:LOW QUALITY PROTEIN: Endogenous retrovirus group K member 25 Env polyprotein [Plecturocebus cupreus]
MAPTLKNLRKTERNSPSDPQPSGSKHNTTDTLTPNTRLQTSFMGSDRNHVEKFLQEQGIPKTTGNLILAAFMVVTAVVSIPGAGAVRNYTYWAYAPFPPLIQSVSWMDFSVEIYSNNSAFMPALNDDRYPAQPEEEGMNFNLAIECRFPPLCIGKASGCLKCDYQNWIWTVPFADNASCQVHNVFSSYSFQLPMSQILHKLIKCPHKDAEGPFQFNSTLWENCNVLKPVLLHSSHMAVIIDWASKGYYWVNCLNQNTRCHKYEYLLNYMEGEWSSYKENGFLLTCSNGWKRELFLLDQNDSPYGYSRASKIVEIGFGYICNWILEYNLLKKFSTGGQLLIRLFS